MVFGRDDPCFLLYNTRYIYDIDVVWYIIIYRKKYYDTCYGVNMMKKQCFENRVGTDIELVL